MAKYKLLDGKKIKLTDEEEKLLEANAKEFAKINDAQKKIEEQTKKNKESATTKLKDLGLTDDEITALIGG
mgnify:CR=1 FL=1